MRQEFPFSVRKTAARSTGHGIGNSHTLCCWGKACGRLRTQWISGLFELPTAGRAKNRGHKRGERKRKKKDRWPNPPLRSTPVTTSESTDDEKLLTTLVSFLFGQRQDLECIPERKNQIPEPWSNSDECLIRKAIHYSLSCSTR